MSLFDNYRDMPDVYHRLLVTDPRRHPWLRWGLTPQEIAQAQHEERRRIALAQASAQRRRRMRGAGDVVARATSAVGIQPCGACKRRQATLNRWFPFR